MTDAPRRDPEAMLARLRTEEPQAMGEAGGRGQLKIFFGYAAGVGKTYTMLDAARQAAAAGREAVVGYVEPHGRSETEALLEGLEMLPTRPLEYRGVTLYEFDLDAALARRPEILIVDELAHTNAPGSRHIKRWQDVRELIDAGIQVWTTLNVQHVESLNDIVAQITGVQVRETLPDQVFDEAAEVELVDLPPEELLERFREGKVYVPEQAERAASMFFRRANLIALRELALRRVADRIGREVQTARLGAARTKMWPTRERLLVCVGPSPTSARVIRTAKRLASALDAEWIAVHAETAAGAALRPEDRQRLAQHLKLAEQLGAETVTLTGEDVPSEIVRYAQTRNVTKIVIGKTGRPPRFGSGRRSVVDRLIAQSGDIDVYVIRGAAEAAAGAAEPEAAERRGWRYPLGAAILAAGTGLAHVLDAHGLTDANLVMTFLLTVVVIAAGLGRGPAVAASVAAVLLYNFFFTQPRHTFVVDDPQHLYTFAVMLAIALTVSELVARIREQAGRAREREQQTGSLYRVSRRLSGISGMLQLVAGVQEELGEILGGRVVVYLEEEGRPRPLLVGGQGLPDSPNEREAARWVLKNARPAGLGTDTLPSAGALYLPLVGRDAAVGVLAWKPEHAEEATLAGRRRLADTLATQIALTLERERLAQEAQRILAEARAEKLRSSLLSAVSHDLRTPLTAIAGSASSLLEGELDAETRRDLAETIYEESHRLSRLVENLLHLTRLESGTIRAEKQWQPVEEVVGSALRHSETLLRATPVKVELPAGLPMAPFDGLLVEQVLINLLDNAAKYSAKGSPVDLSARTTDEGMEIAVADRGPGLTAEERERIFDRFYRGAAADRGRGAGLGLTICRAIVQAHGGRIWAEDREGGGTVFRFVLPMEAEAAASAAVPPLPIEEVPR